MNKQQPAIIHEAVKEHYGKMARESGSCCGQAGAAPAMENLLYPGELLSGLPSDVTSFSAGSGDPVSLANLQPGEIVLDLGSGGGLDCFLAARQVGGKGRVIGVDMTPEMLARARASAARLKVDNVEFREGYLEKLPVEDGSVDVILSNCVINLSPDKPAVLREMFRTLKPGGRIAVSDIVTNRALPEGSNVENQDWCACVSGALPRSEYESELRKAGFVDIRLEPNLEVARKAIESGQVKIEGKKNLSAEEILERLRNWESLEGNMFAPYLISARKPAVDGR